MLFTPSLCMCLPPLRQCAAFEFAWIDSTHTVLSPLIILTWRAWEVLFMKGWWLGDNIEKAEVIEHLIRCISYIYYIATFMLTFNLLQCETKITLINMLLLCFMCKQGKKLNQHMKIINKKIIKYFIWLLHCVYLDITLGLKEKKCLKSSLKLHCNSSEKQWLSVM